MKRSKWPVTIFLFLCLLGVWYLFVKRDDYIVQFEIATVPGTVMYSLEEWNRLEKKDSKFDFRIVNKEPYEHLHQTLDLEQHHLDIHWDLSSVNDSTSQVRVGITEPAHSIRNRVTVPFSKTEFKNTSIDLVKSFKAGLELDLREKFRVHTVGTDTLPGYHLAYISLKNVKIRDKAKMMMQSNGLLLTFLNSHRIERAGFPIIEVDRWDKQHHVIDFKLGFPVVAVDSFPEDDLIQYVKKDSRPSVRAIFNGNYRNSDRAWYHIETFATSHGIQITENPVEIFYNNPFLGGNELEWKAVVYVPVVP